MKLELQMVGNLLFTVMRISETELRSSDGAARAFENSPGTEIVI